MAGVIDRDEFPHAGQRINAVPARTLVSPAFDAPAPTVVNPQHFDPGVKEAMEFAWNKGHYDAVNVQIFHLENVYFCGECLIFNEQLQVIDNASDPYSDEEVESALELMGTKELGRRVPHYAWGVVSKRRAVGNYAHFLLEMLPMTTIGRTFAQEHDPLFVVHRVQPELQDVVFRSMRLLGIPLNRLLVPDYREPIYFNNLVIVRGLTQHGSFMSPLCMDAMDEMAAPVSPGTRRKLFIRRAPGWNRGRALLNQEQVCERLAACGFDAIDPGTMTLEQQIAAFRGADHVVGVSGAAMANIVFCKPGTRITMIVPGRFPDTFFWFIGVHKQHDFTEMRIWQEPLEGADSWKADFSMSEADIAYIEASASPDRAAVSAMGYLRGGVLTPPNAADVRENVASNHQAGWWSRLFGRR